MNIWYTVEPNNRPSLNEWMEQFKVSTRVAKHPELLDRAKCLMDQYSTRRTCAYQHISDIWAEDEDLLSYYRKKYLRESV